MGGSPFSIKLNLESCFVSHRSVAYENIIGVVSPLSRMSVPVSILVDTATVHIISSVLLSDNFFIVLKYLQDNLYQYRGQEQLHNVV